MKRYIGNTGAVESIPEPEDVLTADYTAEYPRQEQEHPDHEEGNTKKRPHSKKGILSELSGLFSRAVSSVPETEDLILIAVLYLMYKESGDIEFLLIAGAMLFL